MQCDHNMLIDGKWSRSGRGVTLPWLANRAHALPSVGLRFTNHTRGWFQAFVKYADLGFNVH